MKLQDILRSLKQLLIRIYLKTSGHYRQHKLIWLVVLFVIIGLVGIHFAYPYRMIDFSVYYYSALSLIKGRTDLYAPDFAVSPLLDYRYPPLFVFVICPLAFLSQTVAGYLWFWLCVLEIGGCVFFVRRMIAMTKTGAGQNEKIPSNPLTWLLTFFTVCVYFIVAIKFGNAHILVTFLLFGAFYFVMRRQDGWAGALMALAITFKIIPLIALPYFVVKQRWRFVILTVVFSILLNLIPAFYFGFNQNLILLRTWYDHVVVDHESHEKNSWLSISLKGQLLRYLTEENYSQTDETTAAADHDYPPINITSIPEETANQMWLIISGIVYLSFLAVTWFKKRNTPSDEDHQITLVEYSLVICLMLFIGPLTPKLYFIMLLLPVAFLAHIVFSSWPQTAKINRWILILIAAANVVLPLIPGRAVQRLFLALGIDFYIVCLLVIVGTNLLLSYNRIGKFLNFKTE